MNDKLFFFCLLFIISLTSCSNENNKLNDAYSSLEYSEYRMLIDINSENVLNKNIEKIKPSDIIKYENVDNLVEAGKLSQNSLTYRHFKNYERIGELNNILIERFGYSGAQISQEVNKPKNRTYYKNIYNSKKIENEK